MEKTITAWKNGQPVEIPLAEFLEMDYVGESVAELPQSPQDDLAEALLDYILDNSHLIAGA